MLTPCQVIRLNHIPIKHHGGNPATQKFAKAEKAHVE